MRILLSLKVITSSFLFAFLIAAFGFSSPADAVEVEGLYQVKVAVADQSPKARWNAVLTGFKEVLIRKSGSSRVLSSSEVQQAYSKVTAYLERFEYAANDDKINPFLLQLDFSPRLIEELIQVAGMPIWGSNRPVTLLWLASEQALERNIVAEGQIIGEGDSAISFSELAQNNAQRRGVPLILPLMDLEDEMQVSISDIWGRFNGSLVEASQRYAADAVIIGRIQQVGTKWQAKLSYVNQEDERQIEFSQPSLEQVFAALTDQLAEILCLKYCVVEAATSRQISLQVDGISNFSRFKKAQDYLQGLSAIRKVEVAQVAGTSLRFNLSLLGDLQSVKDALQLGNKMVELEQPLNDIFAPVPSQAASHEETTLVYGEIDLIPAQQESNIIEPALSQTTIDESALLENNISEPAHGMLEETVRLYYRWVE